MFDVDGELGSTFGVADLVLCGAGYEVELGSFHLVYLVWVVELVTDGIDCEASDVAPSVASDLGFFVFGVGVVCDDASDEGWMDADAGLDGAVGHAHEVEFCDDIAQGAEVRRHAVPVNVFFAFFGLF